MTNLAEGFPRPKILIVEDELLVAMDVEMQLHDFGYEVVGTADTGRKALQLIEETHPDLILLDVNLRGSMDGVATAAQLRSNGSATPIIFVTAFGSEDALSRAQSVEHSGYVAKPYRFGELRKIIQTALR